MELPNQGVWGNHMLLQVAANIYDAEIILECEAELHRGIQGKVDANNKYRIKQ